MWALEHDEETLKQAHDLPCNDELLTHVSSKRKLLP